ncbi:hypothetical protein HBI56_150150 [Parastagonospora nodorum]|nr:hypothetical protein HBH51_155980 [Parastagonospora nodorum]KAH3995494.1 hypothetical protein HBI10_174080 [Parastagonospora nodorum]KAH4016054.1 hypothetical protein HBI13_152670 [Parastagonospora nodorum]KAH4017409.1 hypothetical protein HBI09_196950 [Parastagonospora nodorum]KAH4117219.1 hypothetical protein HBH47_154640 [Parastagonospora nodorum]
MSQREICSSCHSRIEIAMVICIGTLTIAVIRQQIHSRAGNKPEVRSNFVVFGPWTGLCRCFALSGQLNLRS